MAMFVVDVIDGNIEETYSSICLVTALYIESNVSLCLPTWIEESTLNIVIILDALNAVLLICVVVSLNIKRCEKHLA